MQEPIATIFEFTLRIDARLEDEADMDAVYTRCPDCSLLVEGEATLLHFERQARSLHDAIRSAIADAGAAGHHVASVEMAPDAVTTWPDCACLRASTIDYRIRSTNRMRASCFHKTNVW